MNDEQLLNQVFICALETVGFTQFIKQLLKGFGIKKPHANVLALIMVILAVAFTFCYDVLPVWITGAILVVVVSQLFYETVFQTLQRIVQGIAQKAAVPPRLVPLNPHVAAADSPATADREARAAVRAAAVPLE